VSGDGVDYKALYEKSLADAATDRTRLAKLEAAERANLEADSSQVKEYISTLQESLQDAGHRAEIQRLAAFTDSLHQSNDLESAKSLSRLIVCSNRRRRDELSDMDTLKVKAGRVDALNAELETLKTALGEKESLLKQMGEQLAAERTAADQALKQAEESRIATKKFDFSSRSSREEGAVDDAPAATRAAVPAAVASSSSAGFSLDQLIQRTSVTTTRLMPTPGSHSLLGSQESDGNLLAALKA
jgi:hypothetical protein